MNVHFVEKKGLAGLSGKWKLPLGKYYVDVYVWVNKDGLLSGVQHADEDFVAAYVHYPARKHFGGLFGEIHIMEDECKPGIVAHELEHAVLDWSRVSFDRVETNPVIEQICEAMEGMTKVFWDEYADVFMATELPAEPEMPTMVHDELTTDPVSDFGNPFLLPDDASALAKPAGEVDTITVEIETTGTEPAKPRRSSRKAKE